MSSWYQSPRPKHVAPLAKEEIDSLERMRNDSETCCSKREELPSGEGHVKLCNPYANVDLTEKLDCDVDVRELPTHRVAWVAADSPKQRKNIST